MQTLPHNTKKTPSQKLAETEKLLGLMRTQNCPVCNALMGDMPGTRDAVCKNCGFKDPCCE